MDNIRINNVKLELEPLKDMKAKFEIEKMNLFYGDFHALKNISMKLYDREITAFIGPSGCGKSTLLKSLNRILLC